MKISCEEAVHICSKSQYKEATFMEKVKLKWHLLYCKACNGFSLKNKKLTALFRKAHLKSLSESEKQLMKEKMAEKS